MSVWVRGMVMPKACFACIFLDAEHWECRVCGNASHSADCRPTDCPLVEVHTPHGRLIDADALIDDVRRNSESYFADDFAHEWVDNAPTIIPAEEGE